MLTVMLLGQKILLYHICNCNVIKVSWYDFVFYWCCQKLQGKAHKFLGYVCLWGGCLNVPVEDSKTCESQIDDGETAAIMGFVGTCLNALELHASKWW